MSGTKQGQEKQTQKRVDNDRETDSETRMPKAGDWQSTPAV